MTDFYARNGQILSEITVQRMKLVRDSNVAPRRRGRPRLIPQRKVVQLIRHITEAPINPIILIEYTDESVERHVCTSHSRFRGQHSVTIRKSS